LVGGSRTICDTLKAREEVGETLRDSTGNAARRSRAFGSARFAINLLTEVGLGVLEGGLPRFKEGSHADLSLQLPVHECATQLLNGHYIGAVSLRADLSWYGGRRLNGNALASVGRVVDVGQVVACHFDALLLGLQRALGEI